MFTSSSPDSGPYVRESSEDEILARILPLLPVGSRTLLGAGDDCAVIAAPDGRFVVSTDVLVEDRHFRRQWSSGYDIGWRAAMQNLADVAAMGAIPTALVVALAIPGDLPLSWVEDLARGLADAARLHGAAIVGGDLSSSDQIMVTVTVHGDLEGREPVTRDGAKAGDDVWLVGPVGLSIAGFAVLAARFDPSQYTALVDAYLRPRPPVPCGKIAATAGATSMIDVSDGLVRDAGRVARASGVVLDLDLAEPRVLAGATTPEAENVLSQMRSAARGFLAHNRGERVEEVSSTDIDRETTEWILTGGEDHALLLTVPHGVDPGFPVVAHRIGRVHPVPPSAETTAPDPVLVQGERPAITRTGWDHFGH